MTAGLPGVGLSGLFLLMSAMLLPLVRRRSTPLRPAQVRSVLTIAIVAGVLSVAVWELAVIAIEALTGRSARHSILGLPTVVWSLAILAVILLAVELIGALVTHRPTPTPPPIVDDDVA